MADVFVKDRAAISGCGAVNGDVIYLTDQEEVYDASNSKLTLVSVGVIKVSASVWAVPNRTKSLDYRLTKPPVYDTTKKYTKGTLVTNSGNMFIANGDIPANTAFASGTTGATWTRVGGASTTVAGTLAPSGSSSANEWHWTTKGNRISTDGFITKFTLAAPPIDDTWIIILRPTSGNGLTVGDAWTVKEVFSFPKSATSINVLTAVTAGDYIGVAINGGFANLFGPTEGSSGDLLRLSLKGTPVKGTNGTLADGINRKYISGLGWEITA